jgi:hypothetical protein
MLARIVFERQGMTKKSRVGTADGAGERYCVLEFLQPTRVESWSYRVCSLDGGQLVELAMM